MRRRSAGMFVGRGSCAEGRNYQPRRQDCNVDVALEAAEKWAVFVGHGFTGCGTMGNRCGARLQPWHKLLFFFMGFSP
jgi:hypothetical protein